MTAAIDYQNNQIKGELTEPESVSTDSSSKLVEDFIALYQELNSENLHRLAEVYSENVVFQDPLHQIAGLKDLTEYFAGLYCNISAIRFEISESLVTNKQASLFWQMHYCHPKLNGGKSITVVGMSQLKFGDKIHFHRDYFDLGQMLYEPLPILGSVVRKIKKGI